MDDKFRSLLEKAFNEMNAFSIPGIGTFENGVIPAIVDAEENEILPPTFGWLMKAGQHQMTPMEAFIANEMGVSTDKAGEIARELGKSAQQLMEGGIPIKCGKAGILSMTEDGDYLFEAEEAPVDEFFGLMPVANPFTIVPSSKTSSEKVAEPKLMPTPVVEPPVKKEIEKEELQDEQGPGQKEKTTSPQEKKKEQSTKQPAKAKRKRKKKKKGMPPLAIVGIVLLVLCTVGLGVEFFAHEIASFFRGQGVDADWLDEIAFDAGEENANVVPFDSNAVASTDSNAVDSAKTGDKEETGDMATKESDPEPKNEKAPKEETSKEKTPVKEKDPPKEKKIDPPVVMDDSGIGEAAVRGNFYLVAKTFPDGTAAEAYSKSLSKPGYEVQVLKIRANRYYVTVFASSDKMEVIRHMVEWKTDFKPNSWIYTP